MKHRFTFLTLILISTLNSFGQTNDLTGSLNNYSFDLYREIKTGNDNLFVSPLSTYSALLIAYEGAGSETKKEFDKVLYIGNSDSLGNFRNFFTSLTTKLDNSNYLNIANAIWIQDNYKIESNYINNVKNKYLAEVKSVDFLNKQIASAVINNWVSHKTNDLIKEIVSSNDINQDTRLIISNAIYFVGKWANEFDKRLTKTDYFYSITKIKAQVNFMNQTEDLRYFENDDFQFVSIPYEGFDKSFCIILPKKTYGISDIETVMNNELLESILKNSNNLMVKLSLPKFKLETSYSLIEPLKRLGLKTAFTPNADFSYITREEPLMINEIKHKAYIEIDEKKTVAAATTASLMVSLSMGGPLPKPKIFKADHPFIFMIVDNKTKGIIFMGKFVRPE